MSIRRYENLHVPLWLLKDTCWMMEWKTLGMIMIIPTILMAVIITLRTRKTDELFINLAICFWIIANAFWMCCEFTGYVELKNYAGIPFVLGMVSVGIFYIKNLNPKSQQVLEPAAENI